MSLRSIFQDLASSLSIDEAGLLCSTLAAESELIESANEVLSDPSIHNPNCRLWFLRDLIYTRLYLTPKLDREESCIEGDLYKNSISGGVKSNFFQRLHHSNTGQGYADSGWEIIAFEDDGYCQVHKDGLTLWVKPNKHLIQLPNSMKIGEVVEIRLPKNILDPGVYIAVGNAGPVRLKQTDEEMIQLHFNFESSQAPNILAYWTEILNQVSLPFCFAVGHETANYDRADPGVLLIQKQHRSQVLAHLQNFLVDHAPWLRSEQPLLTKDIAPGVGYSEVPIMQPTPINFHLHRCQLMAQGLLAMWKAGTATIANDPAQIVAAMNRTFEDHGVRLEMPYLNPDAEEFEFQ